MKQTIEIGGCKCLLYTDEHPQALLIQTLGQQEHESIEREVEQISHQSDKPFVMAAFYINDWEAELTPWHDPAVSKRQAVGEHAFDTLDYITGSLIPYLKAQYGDLPVILGGYSLGGLFARWAVSKAEGIDAVAAVSPSLWICARRGFSDAHDVYAKYVYLSLGDREEFSKNKAIAQVGDNIRWEHEHLKRMLGSDHTTLEWNSGNHFMNAAERTAKGFAWCISKT
ncbi:MAG: esterase, partial [Bacteroidaceae bacterium]|nr:esterase [Bacteroidaceae bacterium]